MHVRYSLSRDHLRDLASQSGVLRCRAGCERTGEENSSSLKVVSSGVRTDGMAGAASVVAFVNMGGTTCFVRRRALACGDGNEGIFTETVSPTEIDAVGGSASCLPFGMTSSRRHGIFPVISDSQRHDV